MKGFFKVTSLEDVLKLKTFFIKADREEVNLEKALGRILGRDLVADADLPDFRRSTMDGFAVMAASTFGASESNPAYLNVIGSVAMGEVADSKVGPGEAVRIPTGGMLPQGADSVVMVEHTDALDDFSIEVYKPVAPNTHMVEVGEDYCKGQVILKKGTPIRPQECGLLAASGNNTVLVCKKPVVGIISTGDEVVPINEAVGPGRIRDINTYALAGLVEKAGAEPVSFGIVKDDLQELTNRAISALDQVDILLVSGGSSVGARDFTIEVIESLTDSEILVHGISISPGKPTILARAGKKQVWGLPGHAVSSMIVFEAAVRPFIEEVAGIAVDSVLRPTCRARLSRNISSAQGRVDFLMV